MLRRRMALLTTAVLVAAVLPAPAAARGAGQRGIGAESAVRNAERLPKIRALSAQHGGLRAIPSLMTARVWRVSFYDRDKEIARVQIARSSGRPVSPVYTGLKLLAPTARGLSTAFRDRVSLATLVLCILFVLPFVDPRRPRRMLHLDLSALLGFEVAFLLLEYEHLEASVYVQYLPLLYVVARFLWLGLRGRRSPPDEPVPYASSRLLAAGLVVLLVGRIMFNEAAGGGVGDVGYAGLFGADSIRSGFDLYTNNPAHLDAYGPLNYLFYIPFEAIFPFDLSHTHVQGAQLAAITLDLAVVVLLIWAGRRFVPGPRGRRVGLAAAYAWAAYPMAFFPLAIGTNDAMVPIAVLAALLAYRSAPGRGLALGLGGAAKFAPLGLLPLFALGRERSLRAGAIAVAVGGAIFALIFLPYVAQTSLSFVWDRTVGFQLHRDEPFSLWGLHASLGWLHVLVQCIVVAIVAMTAVLPRERTVLRVAALAVAVTAALQLVGSYWAPTYVAWFVAPAFLVLFADGYDDVGVGSPARAAGVPASRATSTSGRNHTM